MWTINGAERRRCPEEFQARIDEHFGLNRFGEPLYKLVWAQSETTLRLGVDGYEEQLLCANRPCWSILKWLPPERFGTPDLFYFMFRDEETGKCLLGQYPHHGAYVEVQPLFHKESRNGTLHVQSFPLSHKIIDLMIPLLHKHRVVTKREIEAARKAAEVHRNTELCSLIADKMADAMPSYLNPVSFAGQGNKTSAIDRKLEEMERFWKHKGPLVNPQRGFQQL